MKDLYEFLKIAERLKTEMRHSWLSDGRRESVAEHTWRMSLMLMLIEPRLSQKIDFTRAIRMIIVHDLVEIYAGDIPVTEVIADPGKKEIKHADELRAMDKIAAALDPATGQEIRELWMEYEENKTIEAKVVKAIDKLEVQLQHNQADLKTWEDIEFELTFRLEKYTAFDKALDDIRLLMEREAENIYRDNGIDPDACRERARRKA